MIQRSHGPYPVLKAKLFPGSGNYPQSLGFLISGFSPHGSCWGAAQGLCEQVAVSYCRVMGHIPVNWSLVTGSGYDHVRINVQMCTGCA